jgi:hypothetical protein
LTPPRDEPDPQAFAIAITASVISSVIALAKAENGSEPTLTVSVRTVRRDWTMAKLWLRQELKKA